MKIVKTEAVIEEAEYKADNNHEVNATSFLKINVGYPSSLYDGCSFDFHMDDILLKKTLDFLMSQVDQSTTLKDYVTSDLFGNVLVEDGDFQDRMGKVNSYDIEFDEHAE